MGRRMRILFIWPNRDTFGCKPIGIALLMAELRRAGHDVDLFDTTFIDLGLQDYNAELTKRGYFKPVDYGCDVSKKNVDLLEELQKKIDAFKPELFALSVLSDEVEVAAKIMLFLEDEHPGKVLVGNKGAIKLRSKLPIASACYFPGESIGIIADYIKKKIYEKEAICQSPGYFRDLDSLPYLDWSCFDPRHFLRAYDGKVYRSGDHMIGWGCPNSCTYCINESWRKMHGGMKGCMRRYSVERIIEELELLKTFWRLEFFKFHDEDFLLKPEPYFRELSSRYNAYISAPFSCMTNAKSVTETRAKLLSGMGCVSVSMGIETGNPVLRGMLNRKETPEDIIRAVGLLEKYGIRVSSFNMIGLPFESSITIEETIALNKQAGIKNPNVSFFMPLEGTKLYDIAVSAGLYKPGSELRTDRPSLKLPLITEKELHYYYDNFHRLIVEDPC
jgi:sulfatase maturation enzyme AslB (radical SAM superfamily)